MEGARSAAVRFPDLLFADDGFVGFIRWFYPLIVSGKLLVSYVNYLDFIYAQHQLHVQCHPPLARVTWEAINEQGEK